MADLALMELSEGRTGQRASLRAVYNISDHFLDAYGAVELSQAQVMVVEAEKWIIEEAQGTSCSPRTLSSHLIYSSLSLLACSSVHTSHARQEKAGSPSPYSTQ